MAVAAVLVLALVVTVTAVIIKRRNGYVSTACLNILCLSASVLVEYCDYYTHKCTVVTILFSLLTTNFLSDTSSDQRTIQEMNGTSIFSRLLRVEVPFR